MAGQDLAYIRRSEPVCLLSCENDAARILGGPVPEALDVIDCSGTASAASKEQRPGQSTDIEDLDGISRRLRRLSVRAHLGRMRRTCASRAKQRSVFADKHSSRDRWLERPRDLPWSAGRVCHAEEKCCFRYASLRRTYSKLHHSPFDALDTGIALVALYHTDLPSPPSSSSTLQLFPSLCSPSFCASFLRLTVHPPSLLSHLHRAYGIERVGQEGRERDEEEAVDMRVFDFLGSLHARIWASPLVSSEVTLEESGTSAKSSDDAMISQYDSYNARDLALDGLSSKAVGRCIVEHAMRGMNSKSGRRSEAAKVVRGLSGILRTGDRSGGPGRVTVAADVSDVLRVRPRRLENRPLASASKVRPISHHMRSLPCTDHERLIWQDQNVDPANLAAFNLSLTDRQREARDGVELPYTPRGELSRLRH